MPPIQSKPKVGGPNQLGAAKRYRSEEDSSDEMAKVISLNCKLTNEVLNMKKLLFERTDELIKLQERFHQKDTEYLQLNAMLLKTKKEKDDLSKELNEMKAEQFCSDLIIFDDVGPGQCKRYFIILTLQIFLLLMNISSL